MSYPYSDRGGPQDYDYPLPPGPRRPPPARDQYGPDQRRQPRGPPPMRPPHPSAGAPRGGYPVRPAPPQQYARPPPMEQDEGLYDGSAYGGAEHEQSDSWPLPAPAPAFAQQSRPRSPGSPGGGRGQRRPPQRPQRPDYQEPILDQPRSGGRPPPDPRADPRGYQRGPPPPRSHHGDGQWTGDGYSSTPSNYPPQAVQRPPREPPQQTIPDFPTPQQQQAIYRQPISRPPLGPPPSARKGPASYYPQIAPVHPIVEEADSIRGSIRNVSTIAPSHSSYGSSNAIPIGIPDYYLEERNSMLPPQEHGDPYNTGDESPVDPSVDGGRDSRNTERTGPSPDPAAFVRQASLGKKSKPTLTTVKSGERVRKEAMPAGIAGLPSQQSMQQRALVGGHPMDAAPVAENEHWPPRVGPPARPSYEDDEDDHRNDSYDSSAMPAGLSVAGASNPYPDDFLRKPSVKRRSSDVLSSGTGLMDPSESSEESEKEIERQRQQQPEPLRPRETDRNIQRVPSKELLSVSAALSKEQQHRPRSRSPLAPDVDPRVERIVGGLEKGGALTSEDADQLRQDQQASLPGTSSGLSDRDGRRPRPPKLEMDRVRDAEARGSLTSLPDLIRRATKVASNLDRGKTASRLGMGFFENSSQSDVERMKALDRANRRSNGSGMSDMLSSFPPPRNGEHGGMQRWSSNLRHNALPSTSDAGEGGKKKGRRCCGMPLWLFIMLLIILLLLVAAAVVVPVVLVVLPSQDDSLAKRCESQLTCQNGGVAIADAGAGNTDGNGNGNGDGEGDCRCLCVAGYTGNTCGTYAPAACTTTRVGDTDDATLGNGIPAVLQSAGDFGLALSGQRLLGLFSMEDLTCQAQNALVTFSVRGNEQRDIQRRQQDTASTSASGPAAATSNGLVVAASSTRSASPSQTAPSSSADTDPSSSSSGSSPSSIERESFAGAAVLYLFQSTSDLSSASTAQSSLQSFFSGRSSANASAVLLGGGWLADLNALSLRAGNGSVVTSG